MSGGFGAPQEAGWYPDPWSLHPLRWYDGHEWTNSVADGEPTDAGATGAATPNKRSLRRRRRSDDNTTATNTTATNTTAAAGGTARRASPMMVLSLILAVVGGAGAVAVMRATTGSTVPDVVRPANAAQLPGGIEVTGDGDGDADVGHAPPGEPSAPQDNGVVPVLQTDVAVRIACHPYGVTFVADAVAPALYVIDYGDGSVDHTDDPAANPFFGVHSFAGPGPFTVTIGVLGADGHVGSASCVVDPSLPG